MDHFYSLHFRLVFRAVHSLYANCTIKALPQEVAFTVPVRSQEAAENAEEIAGRDAF